MSREYSFGIASRVPGRSSDSSGRILMSSVSVICESSNGALLAVGEGLRGGLC